MDWGLLVVGVVSGLIGGSGLMGYFASSRERKHSSEEAQKQREHESDRARAERNYPLRLATYQDVSLYLARQERWLALTEPIWGPQPDEPPRIEADDEWLKLGARIALAATDEVRTALQAAVKAQFNFELAVAAYRRERDGARAKGQEADAVQTMQAAREAAVEAIHTAQTAMRDELARL